MLKALEKRLKALADGTRLKVLALLVQRPCCVCELAEVIGFAQPTISRHLRLLVEAGLVTCERRRSFQIYKLAPEDAEAQSLLDVVLTQLQNSPDFFILKDLLEQVDKRYLWETKS